MDPSSGSSMYFYPSIGGQQGGRRRSVSAPNPVAWPQHGSPVRNITAAPRSSPSSGLGSNIPISSLYQSVNLSPSAVLSTHIYPQSYPCSPLLTSHHRLHPQGGTAASYPVLPPYAQSNSPLSYRSNSTSRPAIREATLHTKNPSVGAAKTEVKPTSPRGPKMHLFASRKVSKTVPNQEDFPAPPVEWLLGASSSASTTSSTSSSEVQSGDASEDEDDISEEPHSPQSFQSVTSSGVGYIVDSSVTCQILSVGLKALLKVNA